MTVEREAQQQEFWQALFDFEARPGRYALVLREPRVLFDNARLVLQLCAGKALAGLAERGISEQRAQAAARFFVRTAMFRLGADHYTLLGLRLGFAETELKEHYRMLMRLTHPDYVQPEDGWPADLATRVNMAYDVLSSAPRRANYERTVSSDAYASRASSAGRALPGQLARRGYFRLMLLVLVLGGFGILFYGWLNRDAVGPAVVAGDPSRMTAALQASSAASAAALPREAASMAPASAAASEGPPPDASARVLADAVRRSLTAQRFGAADRPGETVPAKPQRDPPAPVVSSRSAGAPSSVVQSARSVSASTGLGVVVREPVAVPARVAVAVPATAAASRATTEGSAPRLSDVQPYLSGLIAAMLSGKEGNVLAMLDRPVIGTDGANRFMQQYLEAKRGAEELKMGSLQLRSHTEDNFLVVEGTLHFVLLDTHRTPQVRELRLRAHYIQRGGQIQLAAIYPG